MAFSKAEVFQCINIECGWLVHVLYVFKVKMNGVVD